MFLTAALLIFALFSCPAFFVSADGTADEALSDADLKHFSYNRLDDEAKLIYQQLYSAIADGKSEFKISASNSDLIGPALSAILADHPEFF